VGPWAVPAERSGLPYVARDAPQVWDPALPAWTSVPGFWWNPPLYGSALALGDEPEALVAALSALSPP
jgi:hypothetical protein